ncbi:polyphosphate kinase 2 [Pelagicoccus sp. NFK12]|uniref:ADP/GDP-polyphosphate phosphotransferase n=1 Tax=Pelagicoccus enzymogenes TaxID=2773457 RepID=A0A927FA64_9BACT|nr:polyphosphate kinase 2 [Pelagicoccus enzymogenes]MBD5781328.1 polyphosphate kinase 2 [Pelagicoccus enzymogenes]MDQ8199588.1 polyphosphate kinase 2 [Pelagicoccus enzymogenes]
MKYTPEYEAELKDLQRELVLLQQHVVQNDKRLLIIFEGRDAAGKGGAIRHFTRHLNPRAMRVIALPKPTEKEVGQWFFQRYFLGLPNPGEIIFFDRSWYNRAVVEPVMGFCTPEQYEEFMGQVNNIEKMLIDDGIQIIKFWFSINRTAQQNRFEARKSDILKQWKLSTVDALAQEKWDDFTYYKEKMFERTHTLSSPWVIVNGNDKPRARLESIRYVLSQTEYAGKGKTSTRLHPNSKVVRPYDQEYLVAKRESDKL